MNGDDDERRSDRDMEFEILDFLQLEDRSDKAALPVLLKVLRRSKSGAMRVIADMIDPKKPGPWKLELRRKISGAPRKRGHDFLLAIERQEIRKMLEARGAKKLETEACARLAKKHGLTIDAVRSAVNRAWRKYKSQKSTDL